MHARGARRVEHVQRLWGGYGEVVRVVLDDGDVPSVVLKRVAPPIAETHTISGARKRRSYDVEQAFYQRYAARCDPSCRVARMFGSHRDDGLWWFALEDLDAAGFSERHEPAFAHALDACLAWLAQFHACFLGDPGDGLWPEGTYWHLATRLDELAIDPGRARALDRMLGEARYQTIVHGDAKEANFCFTPDNKLVAAVDFQYAGRGCGMKDLAYLLHGHAERHVDTYFRCLRGAIAARGVEVDMADLETEWRRLFPIAQQDFQRFLVGWRG